MKNKVVKGISIACLMALAISCTGNQEEPKAVTLDKEGIKKEIQAKEDEFAVILNGGEVKEIGYYADDAITFYQNKAPITSNEARIAFFKADVNTNKNSISFTTTEVFPSVDGNQVVEVGQYKVSDSTKATINTGNYMSLFEKRNGKYVCIRDMSASDMEEK